MPVTVNKLNIVYIGVFNSKSKKCDRIIIAEVLLLKFQIPYAQTIKNILLMKIVGH